MKWPPPKCWTSPETKNGNRHFQVKNYGGKGNKRWVELFPTKDKKSIFRISFKKLYSEWTSRWISLPKDTN
tara:strand:- start:93 stop:305 length:213 start_codon:yes stop_codon:yes gene_type:complete